MPCTFCGQFPIYTIKDFKYGSEIKSLDFNLGPLNKLKSTLPYPHRHDCFQIVWVEHGTGYHIIDSLGYDVKPGTLFFMSPGQVHDFVLSQDTTGCSINFSPDFFALQLQNANALHELPIYGVSNSIQTVYVDDEQASSVNDTISAMEEEYYAGRIGWQGVIRCLLFILLVKASRVAIPDFGAIPVSRSLLLTRRFKDLLEEKFLSIQDVSEYALLLRVNERTLNEAVRQATGFTSVKIIRERVMLEAKRLMLHSENSVAAVADHLSFEDPAYFSRCFKKHAGCSPLEFRQSLVRLLA